MRQKSIYCNHRSHCTSCTLRSCTRIMTAYNPKPDDSSFGKYLSVALARAGAADDGKATPSQDEIQKWENFVRAMGATFRSETATELPLHQDKQGSLIVIGTGIRGPGQFTMESISHILSADVVVYLAADPLTEAFIRKIRHDAIDLYILYDDDKQRMNTYIQMTECMLGPVRQGKKVAAIFYGHPGVFVHPSHRAIKIAQEEGYEAVMFPGVSALGKYDRICLPESI